jgi:hypothetical protein
MRLGFVLFIPLTLLASTVLGAEPVSFNRDVRPILSDKCFTCHGPDAANKKIPFRLDIESLAKADLGGHRAIVERQPEASTVMQRITADKPARLMPPPYSGLKLTNREVETLKTWIAQGAPWENHWAFLPPKAAELPKVSDAAWPRNEIDRFLLARLDAEGLKPSPEASRESWLRRVSLDLTGVPPSAAEREQFLKDPSPQAHERVVDRLLASPRYGERMAARWLDAARYADTNGYQFDGERHMWRWRDWVIDSFNRNQRYDQFVLEQVAGDLLPNATLEQKIATGFNRNHRANTEDGIIPEEYAVEYVVDRVETTSTVFLGLTLGCARCHNHKYDPLSQKEFYQFYAYFNNVPELGRAMKYGNSPPVIPAPTKPQQEELAKLDASLAKERAKLTWESAVLARKQAEWEKSLANGDELWFAPARGLDTHISFDDEKPGIATAEGLANKAGQFDGKAFVDAGSKAAFDIDSRFSISAWVFSESTLHGSLVSRMVDKTEGKGYGVHFNEGKVHVNLTSNYADDAIRLETEQTLSSGEWHHVLVTYDGSVMAQGVNVFVDGKPAPVKILLDSLYRPFRNAGNKFTQPLRIGAGWGDKLRFKGLVDEVRIYGRVLSDDEVAMLAQGESLNEIASKPAGSRTKLESAQLRAAFLRSHVPQTMAAIDALEDQREKLMQSFPTVMVMAERPQPRDTHILIRGAYNAPGEKVDPGVPSVLPALPERLPNNRLGLARWLIDPSNPLTARVFVNRVWQMYFGTGLVKTVEDFGSQGEWPTHPELLDWLAVDFMRSGWDVKTLHKKIVLSAAYRQTSKATPELIQRDPENRLLARGPRFRMPAEMVRDQALAASGLLVDKVGGPSVKPYQPEGLWKEIVMQDMDYVQSKGDDLYRRSLYTFWKRTVAPPMMLNFDSAAREACVVRENRTNTPLQALNLMNDVSFLEAARFLAQRMILEGGKDPNARLTHGFQLLLTRVPRPEELEVLRASLARHLDQFSNEAQAKKFLAQGEKPSAQGLNAREHAAYMAVASLLFNLDEAVTKE